MGSQEVTLRREVEFDGVSYHLPMVDRGRDLSREEKIEIAEVVCMMYATDQYTIVECLNHCGVGSDNTWRNWRLEIEEIGEMYEKAKREKHETYADSLRQRARTALEKAIDGYKLTLEERVGKPVLTRDGKTIIETVAVKEKEIYIRPSVRAIEMVLYNLEGGTFSKSPEPYDTGGEALPTRVEAVIVGSVPPVTSEEEIKDIDDV